MISTVTEKLSEAMDESYQLEYALSRNRTYTIIAVLFEPVHRKVINASRYTLMPERSHCMITKASRLVRGSMNCRKTKYGSPTPGIR